MTGDDELRAALERRGLEPIVALLISRDRVTIHTLDIEVDGRRIVVNDCAFAASANDEITRLRAVADD